MINVEVIYSPRMSHFITSYPQNKHIEKTVSYICKFDSNNFELQQIGKIEVYMRNGEVYSFDAWVTGYCSQFGINVSDDGQYIYVISDEKGLWCYTYKGEIKWKTRYTSPGYVIPHDDHSITTELSKKIAVLDSNGKVIKEQRLWDYSSTSWLSDELISAQISANRIVLLDSKTLEIKKEISLKKIGLVKYSYSKLSGNILTVTGESPTLGWPTNIDINLLHQDS